MVVAYINKEESMKSGSLCVLLWRLLSWCNLSNIVLQASHIPGRLNVIADKLSHHKHTVKLGGSKLLKKFGVTWVHCFNLKFVFVFTEKKV